jgi:hypothetical protein
VRRFVRGAAATEAECAALVEADTNVPMLCEATIYTAYSPGVRHSVFSDAARVLLATETEAPPVLANRPTVCEALRRALGDSAGRMLLARFDAANGRRGALTRFLQPSGRWVFLDSAEASQ